MTSEMQVRNVSQTWSRWLAVAARLLFAILLVLLATRFLSWTAGIAGAVRYPDQIDYGEGIIWQQADLILRGEGYKDIASLPHIVFHYPPVFHLTSGLLARALGIDQLASGRIVSALSTLGILVFIGLLVYRGLPMTENRLVRGICAGIAGLVALNFYPVALWSAIARVDMLAISLSLLGALIALHSVERPHRAIIAALFFVLAIYTKQTMIAAPAAAFCVLLLARPRAAWLGFFAAAAFGLAALLTLQIKTNGGFLKHVVGYNINRLDYSNGILVVAQIVEHPVFFVLAFTSALHIVLHLWKRQAGASWFATLKHESSASRARQLELFAVCYLGFATLLLVAVLKSGANLNYMIEWICACSIQVGLFLRKPVALAFGSIGNSANGKPRTGANATVVNQLLLLFITLLLILQVWYSPAADLMRVLADEEGTDQFAILTDKIRRSSQPVISDNMVAMRKAGKELILEPAIIAELTALGNWDESEFLAQIRTRELGFFVTQDSRDDRLYISRYSPAVRSAIQQYYPRTENLAGYTLHFPQP